MGEIGSILSELIYYQYVDDRSTVDCLGDTLVNKTEYDRLGIFYVLMHGTPLL